MRPAPSQKLLRSPDFQREQGRVPTFRAKTRGLRLFEAGWEDAKIVQQDEAVNCGAQAGLRIGRGKSGRRGSSDPPGQK